MSYRRIQTPPEVAEAFAIAGVIKPRIWACTHCGEAHFTRQQCRRCHAGEDLLSSLEMILLPRVTAL
jgi:hypothetical protein